MDIASRVRRRFTDQPPSGDGGSGAGPEAVYAGILDGDALWLAVSGAAGPRTELALRDARTGDLISMPTATESHHDTELRTTRFDLVTELPAAHGDQPWAYDVVVSDPAQPTALPVRSGPLPRGGPSRTPASRDGRWQLALHVHDNGLRVSGEPRPGAAQVLWLGRDTASLGLRVQLPVGAEPRLLVLDEEGAVLLAVDLIEEVADPPGWTAWLSEPDLHALVGPARLAVAGATAPAPVVRARNDLRFPTAAIALPDLPRPEAGATPLLKFRFLPSGQLAVARPPV